MKFYNLKSESECECLKEAAQNVGDSFARKTGKNRFREYDFRTGYEKAKQPVTSSCEDICGNKSVSIHMYNQESAALVLERYKRSRAINPTTGRYCVVFKFLRNAGMVRHAPLFDDDFHYDFYKSDLFDLNTHIEVLEVKDFG